MVNNVQFRGYQYIYGPAASFFKSFAQQASPAQKQAFLHTVYNDWMLPGELEVAAQKLLDIPAAVPPVPRPPAL